MPISRIYKWSAKLNISSIVWWGTKNKVTKLKITFLKFRVGRHKMCWKSNVTVKSKFRYLIKSNTTERFIRTKSWVIKEKNWNNYYSFKINFVAGKWKSDKLLLYRSTKSFTHMKSWVIQEICWNNYYPLKINVVVGKWKKWQVAVLTESR